MNEEFIPEPGYPAIQVTWQQGSYNITCRGDLADKVFDNVEELRKKVQNSVGNVGTVEALQPQNNVKCNVCGSATQYKTIKTKTGSMAGLYQCTNPNCKNDNGYPNSQWESQVKKKLVQKQ